MQRLNYGLAILSALLLILIFPRFDYYFLAPVALTPILIALNREYRARHQFLLGYIAGIIYWLGVCYWIQAVLAEHGGLSVPMSWVALVLFALAKGAHMGVFALLAGAVMPRWYAIPAAAAIWTGLERTHALLGFTWLQLGNAGIDMSIPMRAAPIAGVYGLSFAFASMAGAAAIVLMRRSRRELLWLAPIALLYVLPALPPPRAPLTTAAVVQPNLTETQEWTDMSAETMRRRLLNLSTSAAMQAGMPRPEMIVWPEVPAPIYYETDASFRARVADLVRITGVSFLFGTVSHTASGAPLNSAAMVNPQGQLVDRYDKINLVPFGEFVPRLFGFVNKISSEAGDFAPGERIVVFPVNDHKVGAFICYESAFGSFVRQFAKTGADVLMNLSNDGYFGDRAAREQHLLLVRMRAAENRRWILRSTNDGITAAIDPAGRVGRTFPQWQEVASRLPFSYESSITPYSRFGDWFAWSCLVLGIVASGFAIVPSYRA